MSKDDDVKGEIIHLFNKAKSKGDEKDPDTEKPKRSTNISITGNNNITSGGDINISGDLNLSPRPKIERPQFTPGPQHIEAKQAKQIKDAVDNLVSKEEAGGMPRKKAYSKWWGVIKDRYEVSTYKEISYHLGDEALSWIKQQSAIKRTKIRRTDNTKWRNELYGAIWARARNLNLSKGEVYNIVYTNLEKRVSSLTQLGEQNLKKLHSIIMRIK
jgi:hypothetical protein